MKITITVPKTCDDDYFDKICDGFRKKYGDTVTFEKETADIIGGFIAEVDGTVFDTSVRSKLKEIKRVITE